MSMNEYLILVNAEHPLKSTELTDLVSVCAEYPDILIRREAQSALSALLLAIGSGDQIVPVSGYRSRAEQVEIYESSLKENGLEFTRKYVALPGCSEHETGLAIDLALNEGEIDFICPDFPYDGICGDFRKAAADFGFIERYPKGKESVTGIGHEPWHFRYVGCPHARTITELALTLEEYISSCPDKEKDYEKDKALSRN